MKYHLPFKLNYKSVLFFPFAFIVFLISVRSIEANLDAYLHPRKIYSHAISIDSFLESIPYQILFILAGYFILFLIGNIFYSVWKIFKIQRSKKQFIELFKVLTSAAVLNGSYLWIFKPDTKCWGDACRGIISTSAIIYFWSGLILFLCISLYQELKNIDE